MTYTYTVGSFANGYMTAAGVRFFGFLVRSSSRVGTYATGYEPW